MRGFDLRDLIYSLHGSTVLGGVKVSTGSGESKVACRGSLVGLVNHSREKTNAEESNSYAMAA